MNFLFSSWASLGTTLLTAALVYPLLIVVLRLGGKRTLAKMNAFDFIVTVAIGSITASTVLGSASLAQGVGAIAALVALQALITGLSVRSDRFEGLVKSQPTLVFFEGAFLEGPMRHERVSREEIRSAIRLSDTASTEETAAVVLESDGSFSVMARVEPLRADAMAGVDGAHERWRIGDTEGPFTDPTAGPLAG